MRTSIAVLFTVFAAAAMTGPATDRVRAGSKGQAIGNQQSGNSVLDIYRQYSPYTDPGKYKYLYKNLPDSLPELTQLVKSQTVHPMAELPMYEDRIPKERWNEFSKYPTVRSILEGLVSYDFRGLVKDRTPEHRLVLGCRENAILLASALKSKGTPARVRYGFATYLAPGCHFCHVICEVWNEKDNRWMLVDPSTCKVDVGRGEFECGSDAWLKMQKKEIDPELYGFAGKKTGPVMIAGILCLDMASVLGSEYPITQYAPVSEAFENGNQPTAEQVETLSRISELMRVGDGVSISKLREIYGNNPQLQATKSYELVLADAGNSKAKRDVSHSKPIIEFVDIPAGTFMMGSPATEQGRRDDEVQHKVTVSPFKMSKYAVTYAQYDLFCEATGRRKPWGPERGNLPVSQVTWYDANEFATWMGCKLPTEAQWEYAARANTSTAFYTGDELTTEQANFNGKKALPVGSFPPNAFGLYDMHGNIWQWCSDWYGEYDPNDKLNPQGPASGKRKVDRGGGWYDPAWRCRSAYRAGGDPPGNRGPGMSFRVVKSD
jgi:formylglycine-generating enzyme